MQAIDAGEEPELPQFPWWRALENEYPLSEKGQIKEEEYQASLDAYTEDLAASEPKETPKRAASGGRLPERFEDKR